MSTKKSDKLSAVINVFDRRIVLTQAVDRENCPDQFEIDSDGCISVGESLPEESNELLMQLLNVVDDSSICHAKGLNQFHRLSLLNLKYQQNIIEQAKLKKSKFVYNGSTVLNLRAKTIIEIKTINVRKGNIIVEGIHRLSAAARSYELIAADQNGRCYNAESFRYDKASFTGINSEIVAQGMRFKAVVPAEDGMRLRLIARIDNNDIELKPVVDKFTGIDEECSLLYSVKGGFLLFYEDDQIVIKEDNSKNRRHAEWQLSKQMISAEGLSWLKNRRAELHKRDKYAKLKLQDRVAFVSVRADDKLLGNMEKVYEALDLPKVKYAKLRLRMFPDCLEKAEELVLSSRIVVTDDYLIVFRDQEKKAGQKYVQLWHATGSGKHFGQDGTNLFPAVDAMYHQDYDLVTVSAENIRDVYANAFTIDVDHVCASGVARTDDFFDDKYKEAIVKSVYEKHPEFSGKKIIIYSPTFRDLPGISRRFFKPEVDFDKLSEVVGNDSLFVICPHPVMSEPILDKEYSNILEIRDISTNDMMFVSDLMISDYSSTMFEYSLLDKPMAFFCYDYDSYDRDFYMDFDTELPGPLLKTQEELFDYLRKGDYSLSDNYYAFREKYMSACDGHSTERIVKLIEDMYYNK